MAGNRDDLRAALDKEAAAASAYRRPLLSTYDLGVLFFSSRFVWKCPSPLVLDFYNRNVSARHLDVGVGTGYFLDKCKFPSANPHIALLDFSPNSLRMTARRIARYHPSTYRANVLEAIEMDSTFDSIGLSYLLHCVPGTMADKGIVFRNLAPLLADGGVIFGTTILGQGVPRNLLARAFMRTYNSLGWFSNTQDNAADLEMILRKHLADCSVRIVGCVAFFRGRKPNPQGPPQPPIYK